MRKKTVLWLGSCYERPGRVARGLVGGDGAGRLVGNEVRDEEGGSPKEGSFFVNGNGNAVRLFKNSTFFISESNNLAQKET